MKVSDVIKKLEKLMTEHGDLEVADSNADTIDQVTIGVGMDGSYIEVGTYSEKNLLECEDYEEE